VTLVYRTCETCGIRARRRAVDGTWSEPAELEDFDPLGESQGDLYARPTSPDVAVAPDGRATAVWSIGGQGTRQDVIRTSTYENGAWSPAELLSGGLHAEGDDRVYEHRSVPQVAFDASGRTLVAWTRAFEDIDDRSDWQRNMVYIETGSRAADADAFAPGAEVTRRTATETPSDMRMAVSDAGVATFVWAALATTGAELRARRRSAAGVMGDVGIVNGGATEGQHDHQMPAVAVTPGGDATIVWTHVTQNLMEAVPSEVLARTWEAEGSWGAQALVASAVGAESRDVAAGDDGTVAVSWQRQQSNDLRAAVRLRSSDGTWADNVVLGGQDAQRSLDPFVAVKADGDALAIWRSQRVDGFTQTDWVETMATGEAPVDAEAPQITIATPAIGQHFAQGAQVTVDFGCTDDVQVTQCQGTVADGANLDTSTVGQHDFTVVAKDGAEHETTRTHGYFVDAPAAHDPADDRPAEQQPVPFVPQAPQRYHELRPQVPDPPKPVQQTRAQAALGKFNGQVIAAGKAAPATVKGSALLGGKLDLSVKPLVPNVDVRGGFAVASGGGNLLSENGLKLLARSVANVVAAGGGNVVAAGGGNVVAAGGANLFGPRAFAAAKRKPNLTVLAQGARFFAKPKAGKIRLKVSAKGRSMLRRAFRKPGRQTVTVMYLVGFTERGSGLPTVFTAREIKVRE
jgi:hypothetical protein